MKAMELHNSAGIETSPLRFVETERPTPGPGEVLVRVNACGVCRTDLHIVEGELPLPSLPIIPGHQIVGTVADAGVSGEIQCGARVGIPWLRSTCRSCGYCDSGRENLCDQAQFNGYHRNGGYAEYVAAPVGSVYLLPEGLSDVEVAPLLCAGVIGYRAFRLSGVRPGQRIGLYGFGASAHVTLQLAVHEGCTVFVITRTAHHRDLAEKLGAVWTGTAEDHLPHRLDGAIIFAPAGGLVHHALRNVNKGATVALAGIHMSPIPAMEYQLIYGERNLKSVANSTREDVRELLGLAAGIGVKTETERFSLEEANGALLKLKRSELTAAGVLDVVGSPGASQR
jgi:propanol-preferring alcohol dehydrogenase